VIQIAAIPAVVRPQGVIEESALIALASDGSLWLMEMSGASPYWTELPPLPR
jgi:hypothetical protein